MTSTKDPLAQFPVEQALRKSHCSNGGKEHACVGTCTITPRGVELDCSLCGKDKHPNSSPNEWLADRAASILHAAGMRFASLSEDTRMEVLREIARDACPNCKALHFHVTRFIDFVKCECGWTWGQHAGWKPPRPNPLPAEGSF